jgi:hypothetical protein
MHERATVEPAEAVRTETDITASDHRPAGRRGRLQLAGHCAAVRRAMRVAQHSPRARWVGCVLLAILISLCSLLRLILLTHRL